MFERILHCDWSVRPQGRWCAEASRDGEGWRVAGPRPVGDLPAFLDRLLGLAADAPVLAAFDFPIGLPAAFAERTGFADFPAALEGLGQGAWKDFYRPAGAPEEIGLHRPFFPARPGGASLRHLLEGHGVADVAFLTRLCERGGAGARAAGCMFWTLGAKQVGRAAGHGWGSVIAPARHRGARLWPFDGTLAPPAGPSLTLAESYPGDAYRQIGLRVPNKGDGSLRARLAPALLAWAAARCVRLDREAEAAVRSGFAPRWGGSDGFDAVVGLLAAVAVASGAHPAGDPPDGTPQARTVRRWEGWILGCGVG